MNISILLATFNGAKYVRQQLDSLLLQTYKNFDIIVRDDCSSDETLNILKSYDIKILESNKNLGAKGSFSSLLDYAVHNTKSEYFMFCDQDDIWENDKIEKTFAKMQELEKLDTEIPILIHTDLKVVDENLNTLSESFMLYQGIDAKYNKLNRLLIQNTITGCTMMINRKLVEKCLPLPNECIMHDWWIGLVASAFGKIGYVDEQTIRYRQHRKNTIGAKKFNFVYILQNIFKSMVLVKNSAQAKAFLEMFENELDRETKTMLEDFITIEEKSFWQKRKTLIQYKLLKQGFIRNAGLLVSI